MSQLLGKASPRFPRQAGRSEGSSSCKDEEPEAEQSCQAKGTCCGRELPGWMGALKRQACCHQQGGEARTKPPLYSRNPPSLTQAGVKTASPTSPSLSTNIAVTTAGLAFGRRSTAGVSAGLRKMLSWGGQECQLLQLQAPPPAHQSLKLHEPGTQLHLVG